ncbi:PA2817 family protein [Mangrovimicrobium sediminis]|uniref:PA2817 family protein n=1 Tax=Mangrovimicrobium sediminis TaxID=2562682 RepID=UPI0019803EA2|nr:PA2817 family protein [Haliea sp. SAOS-164]
MNDAQYASHCRERLKAFASEFVTRTNSLDSEEPLRQLARAFADLPADSVYIEGPALVSRLFTTYPDFAPTFPRDLLWFLGGECLHFMPDDEIALYQRLDEERESASGRGEILDLEAARKRLRGE